MRRFVQKVTRIRYTPMLIHPGCNPVTRECSDTSKKYNFIVTERGVAVVLELKIADTFKRIEAKDYRAEKTRLLSDSELRRLLL